jgi:hypothetical protein
MMTRKDYVEVARILNENLLDVSDEMIDDFIAMFKKDNERFDATRFRNAVIGEK